MGCVLVVIGHMENDLVIIRDVAKRLLRYPFAFLVVGTIVVPHHGLRHGVIVIPRCAIPYEKPVLDVAPKIHWRTQRKVLQERAAASSVRTVEDIPHATGYSQ